MAYTYESDQVTNMDAVPLVKNYPYDKGKMHCMFFSYTVPAGNIATNSTVELLRMPKGARLIDGFIANDILTTSGNEAIELGDGNTANLFLASTSVVTAGARSFINTRALQFGLLLTVDTSLVATVLGNPWLAAGGISGYVRYIKD